MKLAIGHHTKPSSDHYWIAANDHLHGTPQRPQDDILAFGLFSKAAEQGNKLAQKQVADMLLEGVGTSRNYIAAIEAYEKAVQDSITNTLWLAQAYLLGESGIKQDEKSAARLYKSFADRGDNIATYTLACLHESGQGSEQSYALARRLLRQAAENGHTPAKVKLSQYLASGLGGAVDQIEAQQWLANATTESE